MTMCYSFSATFNSSGCGEIAALATRVRKRALIMIRAYITLAAFISASTPIAPAHAGDAAAGKAKALLCSACHGLDGNSTNPLWPKLAGQHEAYLVKQMKAFRSGERKDPLMAPMSAGLRDADIDDLAAYYASQKQK